MDPVSQDELERAFGAELDQVVLPDVEAIPWQDLDCLGWVHPAGHLGYLALISPESGALTASVLRRSRMSSEKPNYEMCSVCHHLHYHQGTAMFTLDVKGSAGKHLIGKVLCKNLDCSLRIRNLVDPPNVMPETLYPEAKIWRMQKLILRWLKKANRL